MVTIRLARAGAKRRPFYHLVVSDSRNSRDGRFIERLGFFNPIATGGEERLRINAERVEFWKARGAQTSDAVRKLVRQHMRASAAASAEPATAAEPAAVAEPAEAEPPAATAD
jgi:small subunit ribosomal protein S16